MTTTMTNTNTTIPISKMVNDLFLQWLSLPDTRTTLSAALQSVRTNSKMPEPINYSRSSSTRGSGFSKSQHFDSPPVSPVPRLPSSPRINTSNSLSLNESAPDLRPTQDEKKSRSIHLEQTSAPEIVAPSVVIKPKVEIIETKSNIVESIAKSVEQIKNKPIQIEDKPKIKEIIPKFYFPQGQNLSVNENFLNKQLKQVKEEVFIPKQDKLVLEDFGKVAQLIGLSLYWKSILFRACSEDAKGSTTISYTQFESFWKKVCKTNSDNTLKFIYLLIHSSPPSTLPINRQYLSVDDWDYLIQDIIDTHPGLKFLRDAKEFHSRYIKTVVARIFYNCNRSWSMKLTIQEIQRSNFLQTFDRLEQEEDINRIHDYFSYEHFYVIYCKFWELDSDHDLLISREDLAKHNNGAISNKMIDRIFSGAVSTSSNIKEGKMSYYEFVWFLISEEDKRSPTSIEYWFRCMDLDGDGILSMYELEYFYQEQIHKMEIYGIEYMSFEDCICQMLDLVKPEEANKIRLKDLKRCKLTNIFFDTFFNLEKYLENEQKDPFTNLKDPDVPEVSDWVKYAENEYDNLTHEDGANDNLDDENYDEDFENEDDESPKAKSNNNQSDDLHDALKRWKD